MTEASEAAIEIHQVAVACASLERLLKAHGAIGHGMGELVKSVEDHLPPEITGKLLTLSSVRNRVIHQVEPLGEVRMEAFMADVREVEAYLEPVVLGYLASGDGSGVASGLLPIRSGPIALTPAEIEEAKVARQRARRDSVVRVAAARSFSPPVGHPARLQADRRAALRKVAAFPWWYALGVLLQVVAGEVALAFRHQLVVLLPALVSLVVTVLVALRPGVSFRRSWPVAFGTFLLTTLALLWFCLRP